MPKQFWINIAIQATVKLGAILLVRRYVVKELDKLIEDRPDLAAFLPK